ncbi:unnamed protein product [Trichobilharzia regenti]|nr:unnamed protein product [Trichobilharzia regenti]
MKRVVVLGCGAWGTAIATVIASNVISSSLFNEEVIMYARDEIYADRSLVDWINEDHINPIYLPNYGIPENVVAKNDVKEVIAKADIIAIALKSSFLSVHFDPFMALRFTECQRHRSYTYFIVGLILFPHENRVKLVSDLIREQTGKRCVVVSGATTAIEIAQKQFTEVTIGSKSLDSGEEVKKLLQTSYLKMIITQDDVGVELCGGIKHVVAIAAGICDGLKLGDNTKAAVLRIGFWEMSELMKELFPDRGLLSRVYEFNFFFLGMAHRTDDIPGVGSDLDLVNIAVGRRLSTLEDYTLRSELSKNTYRTFADGVEYAAQVIL